MLNIYCDESCHLENDGQKVMAIGGISCPESEKYRVYNDIKNIKIDYGIPTHREIKWNKVSVSEYDYYEALIKYFFRSKDLKFRAVILPDKTILNHEAYNQTHNDFYYKMYYYLISYMMKDQDEIAVYIDIKDTNSICKVQTLREVLDNKGHTIGSKIVKIQHIRSHENSILQLADLILGSLTYSNRGLEGNEAKLQLIENIKKYSRSDLSSTFSTKKFNLLLLDRIGEKINA